MPRRHGLLRLLVPTGALTSQAHAGFISGYADKSGHLYQLYGDAVTATQELNQAPRYELSHLRSLEAEAIHIIREVAAEFERPVLLFSGGKDSIVMLHLAAKAFAPARVPFPVMHIDTGHNFDEVINFRDATIERLGVRLVVASVEQSIDEG